MNLGQYATTRRGIDGPYISGLISRFPLSAVQRMTGCAMVDIKAFAVALKPDPVVYEYPDPRLAPPHGTMAFAVWTVARHHGLTMGDLRGMHNRQRLAPVRHEAMWACVQIRSEDGTQKFPLTLIGRYFGGRHHTTVMFGERQHARRLAGVA